MSSLSYTVFLSFRGKDTRRNIVSHLHQTLVSKGISTFKDNPGIRMGDAISETLIKVINNSKFAIVVISENYATSSWCLEELRLIMDLEEENKIEVIPLFYGIYPTDVRHYRGSFDLESYRNHKMAEMIPKWRQALAVIAGRNGVVSLDCTDEATMIRDIVGQISSRSAFMLPRDMGGCIIGVEDYMEGVRPLLEKAHIDEVRMIGICGIEGIGKTTIVSYLYEQLKHQFSPHHCFIGNIRSLVELPNGLLELQKKLVLDVISEHNARLDSIEHGAHLIKSRLENLKVLLVLDDVNDGEQLHYLAREATWFGSGSLIIITTRDESILNYSTPVNSVYDVKCLDDEKALQLFKETVFQTDNPPNHDLYSDLPNRISRRAQGLPSTLIALGVSLRGKSIDQWEEKLNLLDKADQDNSKRIIRNSYEKLDEFCKTVFLHVACLFNGDTVARVDPLFNRYKSWLTVLAHESLIDLSSDWIIAMPSLAEEIGKEIVRQGRGLDNNPANQRILWNHDDIYQVVADKSGTSNTEGLTVDVGEMLGEMLGEVPNCIHIEWNVFQHMHNLIFLRISNNSESRTKALIPDNACVPRRLRLLDWDAYPFTALPSMIFPGSVVELNMCNSKLITLWRGTPELSHLRKMDLSGSKYLKQLPDLTKAVYLEELILEGCHSLERIPNSICSLRRLQKLDVSNCYRLKRIMIKIRESETTVPQDRSLGIRSLRLALDDAELRQGVSLTNLSIKGKLDIEFQLLGGYAEYLCFVSEQHILWKHQTSGLILPPDPWKSLDIMRFHCTRERSQFKCDSLSGFSWLMELNLINLNIKKIPDDISQMVELEKLELSGNDFKELPTKMGDLMKLKHLTLCNCRKLEKLPELYQLETLTLSDCTKLTTLVTPLYQGTYRLLELWLDNCKSVENLSDQLTRFLNITYLDISRQDFETVPSSIYNLTSLVTLCLNYCNNLTSMADILQHGYSLKAHGCNSLQNPTYTCLHPTQNQSQITRFPAGRRGEEVPICGCLEKTLAKDESVSSQILEVWEDLRTPWFWCFVIGILVTGLIAYTTNTATIFHKLLYSILF